MEYLGLFCLGAFVGVIATVGLALIKDLTDWRQVLVVILPAVLSGAAMVFVDRFKYSPALGCYPLGLVAALMWAYIGSAVENIKAPETTRNVIGWLHAGASFLITFGAALLVTWPAIRHVQAESAIPEDVRIQEILQARGRANTTKAPAMPASAAQAASAASAGFDASAASASASTAAPSASSPQVGRQPSTTSAGHKKK